jgi:nucleoporin GLE1
MQEIQAQLSMLRMKHQADEERLKVAWRARDKQLWERIEGVIYLEEDKVRRKLEEETAAREREQREAQKKKAEAEEARRVEEERQSHELQAAQEKRDQEQVALKKLEEQEAREAEYWTQLGFATASEDWVEGRRFLKV